MRKAIGLSWKSWLGLLLAGMGQVVCLVPACGAEGEALPPPRYSGGRPLLEVLKARRSVRDFSPQPLSRQVISELLWAAFGVNRPDTGRRTAPSTMDGRAMDIYVVAADGAWRFDADGHCLVRVCREDLRPLTGTQDYVKVAPLALVCVADHRRLSRAAPAEREFYAAADAGFIGQNVYLYCASEGLGCVVHMPGDKTALAAALQLHPEQHPVLVHSVGFPAAR